MNRVQAGALGGLAAGVTLSLLMVSGRRAGLLHKTLVEDSADWLDRVADTRQTLGEGGTNALEQANHLAASAVFGAGFGLLSARLRHVPAPVLGALYGASLYLVNIVGIAPALGITKGEANAPPPVRAQRLGVHVFYGMVTAFITERLRT